ncbi:MAG TPA: hypothetical protein VMA09_15395 [Candidatus Binataceae bacterium]|nr:hypothetical protein [Candidatus Binataceae bacterium]
MPIQTKRRKPGIVSTLLMLAVLAGYTSSGSSGALPAAPQIPRDFQWKGRYIVKDLGADVPFIWQGSNGNLQMTAGSTADTVYFTNLIYNGELYTLTENWPYDEPPPPYSNKCVCLGRLTLNTLNACLNSSRYVGPEILLDNLRLVNHFRIGVMFGETESKPGPVRLPIMEGDFYVDPGNPGKFWKVLHYGLQNLLDPALDEWIVLQNFKYTPGQVTLPAKCDPTTCPNQDVFGPGFYCQ